MRFCKVRLGRNSGIGPDDGEPALCDVFGARKRHIRPVPRHPGLYTSLNRLGTTSGPARSAHSGSSPARTQVVEVAWPYDLAGFEPAPQPTYGYARGAKIASWLVAGSERVLRAAGRPVFPEFCVILIRLHLISGAPAFWDPGGARAGRWDPKQTKKCSLGACLI